MTQQRHREDEEGRGHVMKVQMATTTQVSKCLPRVQDALPEQAVQGRDVEAKHRTVQKTQQAHK